MTDHIRTAPRQVPPSPWFALTEVPRTLAEAAHFASVWPLLRQLPKGDGHPVLVLPGFMAGDASTWPLRRFLVERRYRPLPWRQGTNTGKPELQDRMMRRLHRLTKMYDEPVTLIGQSLGGVFAREIARRFPQQVRQVITLGSPFGAVDERTLNPMVVKLFERLSGMTVDELRAQLPGGAEAAEPVGVPSTAIFSRSDGIVHWQTCLEQESAQTQSVEIVGSHSGMGMNPAVLLIIADRLAQPADSWSKFDTSSGVRRWIYPNCDKPGQQH